MTLLLRSLVGRFQNTAYQALSKYVPGYSPN